VSACHFNGNFTWAQTFSVTMPVNSGTAPGTLQGVLKLLGRSKMPPGLARALEDAGLVPSSTVVATTTTTVAAGHVHG
jgi:hypothetical protein